MNYSLKEPTTVPTKGIYNTNTTNVKPSSPKLRSEGWRFEDISTMTREKDWNTNKGQDSIIHFFLWNNGSPDYYKWVHPKVFTKRWGCPETILTPYCYETLLTLILPHLFGIYQVEGKLIQINQRELIENQSFQWRELNIPQLNSYIYTQTRRLHSLFPENHFGRTIFNSEMFDRKDYPITISHTMVNRMPELQKEGDKVKISFPWTRQGRWDLCFMKFGISWTNHLSPEEKMKEFIISHLGSTLPHQFIHSHLDTLGYKVGENKGRVLSMNRILSEEGVRLTATRKRVDGKRERFITIEKNSINIEMGQFAEPTEPKPYLCP